MAGRGYFIHSTCQYMLFAFGNAYDAIYQSTFKT